MKEYLLVKIKFKKNLNTHQTQQAINLGLCFSSIPLICRMYLLKHWLQYGYIIVSFENKNTNPLTLFFLLKAILTLGIPWNSVWISESAFWILSVCLIFWQLFQGCYFSSSIASPGPWTWDLFFVHLLGSLILWVNSVYSFFLENVLIIFLLKISGINQLTESR